MKEITTFASGTIGAFFIAAFNFLYGDDKIRYLAMALFLMLIVMDWIAGFRASKKDGSYASEYGIDGAFRTAFLLGLPAVGHLADQILGMPGIAFGFLIAATGLHIWKSMTANMIRAGWAQWVPKWAMERVSDEVEHKIARAAKRKQDKEQYLNQDELRDDHQ